MLFVIIGSNLLSEKDTKMLLDTLVETCPPNFKIMETDGLYLQNACKKNSISHIQAPFDKFPACRYRKICRLIQKKDEDVAILDFTETSNSITRMPEYYDHIILQQLTIDELY